MFFFFFLQSQFLYFSGLIGRSWAAVSFYSNIRSASSSSQCVRKKDWPCKEMTQW